MLSPATAKSSILLYIIRRATAHTSLKRAQILLKQAHTYSRKHTQKIRVAVCEKVDSAARTFLSNWGEK